MLSLLLQDKVSLWTYVSNPANASAITSPDVAVGTSLGTSQTQYNFVLERLTSSIQICYFMIQAQSDDVAAESRLIHSLATEAMDKVLESSEGIKPYGNSTQMLLGCFPPDMQDMRMTLKDAGLYLIATWVTPAPGAWVVCPA